MKNGRPAATEGAPLWALLIGIDRYETQPDLGGCVNDVEAVRILLTQRYDVPEEHIRVLSDEEATRANIIEAFRGFLVDNPDIRRGDQVLFHYSGHGSQMPARPEDHEPDGLNETIVPHDSRTPGVFDIPDKTLAALLDDLAAAKGDQITVILDSCHSGSAIPRIDNLATVGVRRVPADDRVPPADLDAELRLRTRSASRAAGPSGWAMSEIPYVLLAACRDYEEAYEYWAADDKQRGVWHGALTYSTLQALREMTPAATYAQLQNQVLARVKAIYPSQTPQCEGDRDRQIFGGERVHRDPFVLVREVDGNVVTLGAGLAYGLRPGTQLDLYPPEVRTRADLPPDSLATVEVTSVSATTAWAEILGAPTKPVPKHARGLITRQVYVGLRQTVALEAAEGAKNSEDIVRLRQAIEQSSSPYLQVADGPDQATHLRVVAAEGKLGIYNANGELLVGSEDIGERGRDDAVLALHALESIVRYRAVLSLINEDPNSQLNGKIKLRLRHYVEESTGPRAEELSPEAIGPDNEMTIYVDPDREERNLYVVDVINESELDIYPYVFALGPDYSILCLYPTLGQQEAVQPNSERDAFSIGLRKGTDQLQFWLPPGLVATQEYFKAIVSTVPVDVRALEQAGLDALPSEVTRFVPPSPDPRGGASNQLEAVVAAITSQWSPRTRSSRPSVRSGEWATAHIAVRVQVQRSSGEQAVGLNEQVVQFYQFGQYERAKAIAYQAYDLAHRHLEEDQPALGGSAHNLGMIHAALGDYALAEQFYREAVETRRMALGEVHPAVAASLNGLAMLYIALDRYDEAEPIVRQALEIQRTTVGEDHPDVATSQNNLAALYVTEGRYDEAESLYLLASETLRRALGDEHPLFAQSLSHLARLYATEGRYDEAESLYLLASETLRRALGDEHPLFAQSLSHLARLYRTMGSYQTAEPLYRQALEIQRFALGETHPLLAENLNALASLRREHGEDTEAELLYQRGLTIQRASGDQMGEATALKGLGAVHTRLGRYSDALEAYEQARAIHREAGNQVGEGAMLRDMGAVHAGQGDYARAQEFYGRALELQRAVSDAPDLELAASLSSLAGALRARGGYENAERLYRQALDEHGLVLGENHPLVTQIRYDLATVLAATDQAFEAMGAAKKAAQSDADLLELLPFGATDSQRSAYLRTIQHNLDVFLSLVIRDFADSPPLLRDSLDLVLRRKSLRVEALADQRETVLATRYPSLESKLRELTALRRQIAHKVLTQSDGDNLRIELEVLDKWYGRKAELQAELARQIPELALAQQLQAVDRQAVASTLPEGTVLAEFVRFRVCDFQTAPARGETCWQPARYLVFLLPAGEPENVQMVDLGEAELIDQMTAELRTMLASRSTSRARRVRRLGSYKDRMAGREDVVGSRIREKIFDPLLESLGERSHLVLAPDGDLIQLPFEVLPTDDGRNLIDTYHFSYLNTGRDALRFAATSASQPSEPLVVAAPDFELGGASIEGTTETTRRWQPRDPEHNLPRFDTPVGVRDEGQRIAEMLGIRPWLGDRVLETAVKAFPAPRILHLATPGFFLADPNLSGARVVAQPEGVDSRVWRMVAGDNLLLRAGLALAGANTWLEGGDLPPEAEDGLLTAEDISTLDLMGTELVVLSSSQLSLGEVQSSESVATLRQAIVLAGARSLVMDLWPVPDQQTSELMQDFYKSVLSGKTHAAALREAQLAMKARYSDPFYWGAFICQGDLSPLLLEKAPFEKADNRYVVGKPAEGEFFVGRQDVLKKIQENLAPTAAKNILVMRGQRRSGKTSVLFRLRDTLPKEKENVYLPVLIDLQGMAGAEGESEFFYRMALDIWESLQMHDVDIPEPSLSDFDQAPATVFEYDFLRRVMVALGNSRRILLMCDEFDEIEELIDHGRLRSEVLKTWRHLMQHSPLLFLIAGTYKLREFTGGYWSVFFNLAVFVDLSTMSTADVRTLITEPVRRWYTIETPAVDEIVRVAGRHPYFTQLVSSELLEVRNEYRVNNVTITHVREALDRALESGDDQIGYPWSEKDCTADERLVLSILAHEDNIIGSPIPVSTLKQRLVEAGVAADSSTAIKRLVDRDVVRRDSDGRLTFVVPLFRRWIVRERYDTLASAIQYNEEVGSP